jgi:hypothetical protein
MTIFYIVTTFVVLHEGAEVADKGAVASREGWLAIQRSVGLGHDVRVVDVRGVQSHLSAELLEPIEPAVGAPLRGGRSRLQDPEAGMTCFGGSPSGEAAKTGVNNIYINNLYLG